MFVDDEEDITEFLCYNFNKKGFEVKKANNGIQAIEEMNNWIPDLMVLDIMMPEMSGVTLCQRLKVDDRFKNIPVIFLSAISDDYKVLNAMSSGAEHFVSKPVKLELLFSIVSNIIEKKEVGSV